MIMQFNMLEIKAPMRVEEIDKSLQAIEKRRNLLTRILEEEIRKLEVKKDQILSSDGWKTGKKNVSEIDQESFPDLWINYDVFTLCYLFYW